MRSIPAITDDLHFGPSIGLRDHIDQIAPDDAASIFADYCSRYPAYQRHDNLFYLLKDRRPEETC